MALMTSTIIVVNYNMLKLDYQRRLIQVLKRKQHIGSHNDHYAIFDKCGFCHWQF